MALFGLFAILYFLVLWLYRQPLEGVLYAFLLCLACGSVAGIWDFLSYKKRVAVLERLEAETMDVETLPAPKGKEGEQYQDIIRQLRAKNRELEARSAEEKSRMADYYTLWVHQVKTPIAAMDLLLQQEVDGTNRELTLELAKIRQYVDMALAYAKLGGQGSDFVLQEYELDDMIRQAVRKFAPSFIYKKLSFSFTETEKRVLTDEKWLVFVLEQLLSNAIKYTREGSISIYMQGGWLVIEDTGIGIATEDLPRVFEQGFTGYNGRKDKKSTGIGLYLCKTVLDRLSHKIRMESQPGVGTKVFLQLDSVMWSGGRPE